MNKTINPLHYKYWIGILIFILVLIVSAKWSNIENLADKISFALTISSVILALLAIYFTINFNSLFSNNIVTFLNLNNHIDETAKKLARAAGELNIKLDSIPNSIRILHEKIDTFTSDMVSTGAHTSEIKNNVGTAIKKGIIEWNEKNLNAFFLDLNYSGMIALYLIAKCRWKDVKIKVSDFEDKLTRISMQFIIGFSTVCSSINLFDIVYVEDTMVISSCEDILLKKVDGMLNTVMTIIEKDAKRAKNLSNMMKSKEEIDIFVAN
ncbi:MAG: hypothetical protein ABSF79_10725 [Smithellaceae bacterium]